MGNNNNSSNSRFLEVQGAPSYSPLGAIPIDQFESVDPDNLEAAQELIEAYGADDPTEDLAAQLMQPQQQSSEFRYTEYYSNRQTIWDGASALFKTCNFISK